MSRLQSLFQQAPQHVINLLNMAHPDVERIAEGLGKHSGQKILRYGGMSNGVAQMVADVGRIAQPRTIKVLRIWSHGNIGAQGVSDAEGVNARGHLAGFARSNWNDVADTLQRLRPYFDRTGRQELRGCKVALGYDGEDFLRALARMLGVPVYGATEYQPIGPTDWAGPVICLTPDGVRRVSSGPPI